MVEVVEMSCGIGPSMMGEVIENVAKDIDCYSIRQPLGVSCCAAQLLKLCGGHHQQLWSMRAPKKRTVLGIRLATDELWLPGQIGTKIMSMIFCRARYCWVVGVI